VLAGISAAALKFEDRDTARTFFHKLTQTMRDWNYIPEKDAAFADTEKRIRHMVSEVTAHA
jgi:hypothetical protein